MRMLFGNYNWVIVYYLDYLGSYLALTEYRLDKTVTDLVLTGGLLEVVLTDKVNLMSPAIIENTRNNKHAAAYMKYCALLS